VLDTGNPWGNLAVAVAAGCLSSHAGGGTCEAGARSSAIIYLYNNCGGGKNGCALFGAGAGTMLGIGGSAVCNAGTYALCGPANPAIILAAGAGGLALGAAADRLIEHGNSWLSPSPTTVYQLTYADTGNLYKYGITNDPSGRYSGGSPPGTRMQEIATFNSRAPARMLELLLCGGYVAGNGHLPPGSSRC
jgi:hypothetical protein